MRSGHPARLGREPGPVADYLVRVSSVRSEAETYATTSTRITGGLALFIGLVCLIDIVIEWRTRGGLIAATVIVFVMVVAYIGLIRPSVTLSPERLSVRNHLRDHKVPWSDVQSVDMADILRVQLDGKRLRCPGVQMMMRDLRRERAGRVKADRDTSVSRAEFVITRLEHHMERYSKTSTGEPVSTWARWELITLAALALIAAIAILTG